MSRQPVIGIDLGGTNMLLCVMDGEGEIRSRIHRETRCADGLDAVLDSIEAGVHSACEEAGTEVSTVGIAVCGAVDHEAGVVLNAGNINWHDVPLSALLSERLGARIVLENDVNASAWGEYTRGAGRGARGMLAAWVGTGIGGGIVLDDQLFRGPMSTAGELGQCIADPTRTPQHIVEDISSRTGMRRLVAEQAASCPESAILKAVGGDVEAIGTLELAEAWAAGDALTDAVVREAAGVLGSSIANVVTILSLDRVVIGGGITEALGDPWLQLVRERFNADVFPPQAAEWCSVVKTELEADAGLYGAAMIAAASN